MEELLIAFMALCLIGFGLLSNWADEEREGYKKDSNKYLDL